MAVPNPWDSTYEPLCGENDPYGRSDTANRYAKTLWTNFIVEHNEDDGSHKKTSMLYKMEEGQYTGNGTSQTVDLTDSSLQIKKLFITGTVARQVYVSDSMGSDETKEVGTAAFQSGEVTSIATAGEFSVGSDNTVNQNSITYTYVVWGV